MPQRTITTELPVELWEFARDVSRLVKGARVEYLNRVLNGDGECRVRDENVIIRELQPKYGINKRVVNAIRSEVKGSISSAKECRKRHLKLIEQQIKSTKNWLKKAEKSLVKLPDACCLKTRKHLRTSLKFVIHQKKRRLFLLVNKLAHLKEKSIFVSLGNKGTQYLTVGATTESFGNQNTQYDGKIIRFRVPYALESKYGYYVSAPLTFEYEQGMDWIESAITANRALSYRVYCKNFRWFIACSTDVSPKEQVSQPKMAGCIGIDINPTVIGWTYVDCHGNLKAHGQFKLNLHSRRTKQIEAVLHDVTRAIVKIAQAKKCPIVIENLDFQAKKSQLREKSRRYARMLSGFTYGKIIELLEQKAELAGIELIKCNPAYSSIIGLLKFMRRYALSSDTAAALVIARRAMKLSERIPNQNAYAGMKSAKHVWSSWNALHKKLKSIPRHQYYTLSNRELEVILLGESQNRPSSKRQRTSRSGESPQRSSCTATTTKI